MGKRSTEEGRQAGEEEGRPLRSADGDDPSGLISYHSPAVRLGSETNPAVGRYGFRANEDWRDSNWGD